MVFLFWSLLLAFIGGVPFGVVNLRAIQLKEEQSGFLAVAFSIAAVLTESIYVGLALFFEHRISAFLAANSYFKLLIAVAFLGAGIFFLVRKTNPAFKKDSTSGNYGLLVSGQGIILSFLSIQTLPFWLFMLAFTDGVLPSANPIDVIDETIFIGGAFLGRFLALLIYITFSSYIAKRLKICCHNLNQVYGYLCLALAVPQFFNYFN